MRKYFKTTIIATIILTLIIAFGVQGFLKKKTQPGAKATPVRLEAIEPAELVEFVTAPGEIEPKVKVDISAKVSARIVELPYEEGELVTKGDPDADPPIEPSLLIKLDAKDLESRLRSAQAAYHGEEAQIAVNKAEIARQEASLEGTAASLKQSQRDFERQKKLLDSHDISQATFDQTESSLAELQSQYDAGLRGLEASKLGLVVRQHNLEASKETIEQAREALSYTTITSPLDGVITRINAEVGEVVMTGTMNNPGTIIIQVADLSQMLLVAQVDEADIGNLKVGQKAKVRVQAFWDEEFTGTVQTIALTHDLSVSRTKYYKTEILLDDSERQLYSGLTADVDIETVKHESIFKVPSQAVVARKADALPLDIRENNPNVDMGKTDALVVYRLVEGKAVVTPVTIGPSDMTHIIVKSGLSQGDQVVVGPFKVLGTLRHDQEICDEKEAKKDEKKEAGKEKETQTQADPNKSDQ